VPRSAAHSVKAEGLRTPKDATELDITPGDALRRRRCEIMGCAFVRGKSIGKKAKAFNIEMAELAAEARGMTTEKLYRRIPSLLEAKRHSKPVDWITQFEVSALLDFPVDFFYRKVRPKSQAKPIIVCGIGIIPCAFCGEVADFRCDAPIGDRRTCDLPLCTEHKHHRPDIGSDIDYCPHHRQERLALEAMPCGEGICQMKTVTQQSKS